MTSSNTVHFVTSSDNHFILLIYIILILYSVLSANATNAFDWPGRRARRAQSKCFYTIPLSFTATHLSVLALGPWPFYLTYDAGPTRDLAGEAFACGFRPCVAGQPFFKIKSPILLVQARSGRFSKTQMMRTSNKTICSNKYLIIGTGRDLRDSTRQGIIWK